MRLNTNLRLENQGMMRFCKHDIFMCLGLIIYWSQSPKVVLILLDFGLMTSIWPIFETRMSMNRLKVTDYLYLVLGLNLKTDIVAS